MEVIPFMPLPYPAIKPFGTPFKGFGSKILSSFPKLEQELSQAKMSVPADEYASLMVFGIVFYFLFFAILSTLIIGKFVTNFSTIAGIAIPHSILVGLVIGLTFSLMIFVQLMAYPKIKIKKRIRAIEANLVYALRNMLVQLRSGVSLFDSLCMIAYSKRYGKLGEEIKETVDEINSGVSEEDALKALGEKNPSPYLRKVIWQIVNGMHAGSDITDVLAESVSTITREQQIDIERYGNSLKLLSLMYLMIGVIIPALGLTFLIVIGSFPRIEISEMTFWFLLGVIIVSEFMFVGLMKSKRPNLISA
jgi:flagellar protein FlaJ